MIYVVDIDGTICDTPVGQYEKSEPMMDRIEKLNKIYDEGNSIIFYTARGMGRFKGDGIKDVITSTSFPHLELRMGKQHAHYFIDDKGINSEDFFA